MKVLLLSLTAMLSLSAFALDPAVKPGAAPSVTPTDPLYQESADQSRGAIVDKKLRADKKKFKPKHTLKQDEKEAELLEQKDESSPE